MSQAMRRLLRTLLPGLGVLALAGLVPAAPAAAQELKAQGADVCFPCHAELKQKFAQPHVHAPVAMGACTSCHNPHAARFPKLLAEPGGELCFTCHTKEKAVFAKKEVHRPVKDGQCTACHDPHAGPEKFQLVKTGGALCLTCHAKMVEKPKKVAHLPFEIGECLLCHNPHASDRRALLTDASTTLCQSCHDLEDPRVSRAHFPFKVERAACEQCHNPHGSDGKALAKTVRHPPFAQGRCGACHDTGGPNPVKTVLPGKDLCLSCHAGITQQLKKTGSSHAPVTAGQCTVCHQPHGSEAKGLLQDREREVCLGCHTKVEERWETSRSVHPEKAGEGRCTICHTPHAADQPRLVAGEPLKVCAACHAGHASMAHPMGAGIVDPRTQRTLTCLSCHDVHGTPLPMLMTFARERELCIQCHKALR
jgi:predicted CXXCH cytochrome family protein